MHWSWLAEYDHHPADWQVVKLGKHINVIAGQSPDGASVNQSRDGLPFLQGNAEFGDLYPTPEFWCREPKKRCLPGDTLISVRAPVGEVNRADQTYGLGRGLAALRATEMDADFLFYGMQFWREVFQRVAQGTTFDAITERHFRQMWVCFPTDDNERKAIARALTLVDDLLVEVRKSIATAERLQKGLMQQLLTGRLKPDGTPRLKEEFRTHPKVGLVPKGWDVSPLKQVAEIKRGKFSHRPRNEPRFFGGPYPFIQTADIVASRGYIRQHSQTLSEEGRRISRMFSKGTIMITIAANIGDTAIAAYDVFATDSVIGITPAKDVDSEFLELCLRMRKGYLERMSTESAQANINYGNLRPLLIAHPLTCDEQKIVAAPILNCEMVILAKKQKIAALQLVKKSLMQNLLTGRIRLTADGTGKEVPR